MLEHGCESTHNAYFRETLQQHGFDPEDYGWASIQLDGGIQRVTEKIARWFEHQFQQRPAPTRTTAGLSAVKLAVVLRDEPSADALTALANAVRMIVTAGGTVVIGEHTPSLLKALGISLQQPTPFSMRNASSVQGYTSWRCPPVTGEKSDRVGREWGRSHACAHQSTHAPRSSHDPCFTSQRATPRRG
ncbi:MAG UNVERIFIED_CONTAM: hypothetical protein LVT10_23065 [Anaerolineae bacterium]